MAMNEAQLMHAMAIDDAYEVVRVLADGGAAGGRTELVTLAGAGPFVRKRIPIALANREVWARLMGCDCARLPQVEAVYELPDEFVAVYDYVEGTALSEVVRERGPLAAGEAVAVVCQLAEALRWLHARGIVHRDVSPGNVVLAADGAHLIDPGIARLRTDGAPRDTTLLGTWGFAAPEQYGFAQTDARSDVFALGRLLTYMLVGALPGEEGYDEAALPAALRDVIARATAFEPSARYADVDQMAAALEAAYADGGAPAAVGAAADCVGDAVAAVVPASNLAVPAGSVREDVGDGSVAARRSPAATAGQSMLTVRPSAARGDALGAAAPSTNRETRATGDAAPASAAAAESAGPVLTLARIVAWIFSALLPAESDAEQVGAVDRVGFAEAFRRAGTMHKVLVVVAALVVGVCPALLFIAAGVLLVVEPDPGTPRESAWFAFAIAAYFVFACTESCQLLVRSGRYTSEKQLARRWFMRLGAGIGLLLLILVGLSVSLVIFGG